MTKIGEKDMLRRYTWSSSDDEETVRPSAWEDRKNVKTAEQAMEAVVDFLSDYGIDNAVKDSLDEVEDLCKKWKIPFNRDLHHKIIKLMDARRWATDDENDDYSTNHYWTSSSEGC